MLKIIVKCIFENRNLLANEHLACPDKIGSSWIFRKKPKVQFNGAVVLWSVDVMCVSYCETITLPTLFSGTRDSFKIVPVGKF